MVADMSGVRDSFLDLERHRLQLGDQIKKLQKDLQHWQTWDAEYEALKEEIDALPAINPASLAQINSAFEGELLKRREIDEIFGTKASKSKEQVINVLDRRIDYVTQNITSLQKQLDAAENKYAAATVISQPNVTDEDGQPITEIIEQLDDDDNVVSYQLKKPGDSLPQLEEALGKAGINDLSEIEPQAEQKTSQSSSSQKPSNETSDGTMATGDKSTSHPPQATDQAPEPVASASSSSITKAVSFAPSTKTEDGPTPQVSRNAKRVEQIIKTAKEQETMSSEEPLIPDDEDEDDAEMRRQMLAYGMGEVGAVVAELELVEGDEDEDDEEFDDSDEGFEDDDDDEDKWGRSTGRMVTDKYRQRMLELEKKLGVKSRFTAQEEQKAKEKDSDSDADDDRIGRIVVKQTPEAISSPSSSKPAPTKSIIKDNQPTEDAGKKGVRFAPNLDIAPNDESTAKPVKEAIEKKEPLVEPLSDIVERTGPTKPAEPKTNRKASRFKKSRGEASSNATAPPGPMDMPARFLDQDRPTAPTGPEGATIADTLVERETSTAPIRPEDDDMVQDEVAGEYQRLRKKFIHREGGFLKEDESPIKPLDESEGGPERVSRFKSARLSRQ